MLEISYLNECLLLQSSYFGKLYANFRRLPGLKVSIISSHSQPFSESLCHKQPGEVQPYLRSVSWLQGPEMQNLAGAEIWQNKAIPSQNSLVGESKL